jgi:DNA sulfur modification protein DndB
LHPWLIDAYNKQLNKQFQINRQTMTNKRVIFDRTFAFSFPAIRGIQAGREYYVAMCPMKVIPKIFQFNETGLPPEIRAQRTLNDSRVPEIARYMLQNPDSYVFSALTASIDADTHFDPLDSEHSDNGILFVSMNGDFLINDGQHRRAAIEQALREDPDLGDETIAVVFFVDRGIQHAQQMFTDLNKHAVQPSPSLNVLYDHRDPKARVIREVVLSSSFYKDLVEMERSNLVARSRKLFTLSALHSATAALLADLGKSSVDENIRIAREFWSAIAVQFKEWNLVHDGIVAASEVRQNYLHTHGVMLHAIGKSGNSLLRERAEAWKEELPKLKSIDWSRSNALWEGRAIVMGRVKKSRENIVLTCNPIKQALGLALTSEEQALEDTFQNRETAK